MASPEEHPVGISGESAYGPRDGEGDDYYQALETGLGRRIGGFRGLYAWSRSDLAGKMGVSEEAIKAWENATEEPTVRQVGRLCDLFKTTPNGLLMGPFYVQPGPLKGLGQHLETLPHEAQMAILFIARIVRRSEGKSVPSVL